MIAAALLAVAAAVAIVAAVAAKGSDPVSTAEYEGTVIEARDRVDTALGRIATPTSKEDLLNRIDEASIVVERAARNLDEVNPEGDLLEQRNNELVSILDAFADELSGTAATLRDPAFGSAADGVRSLSFEQWNAVNEILVKLKEQHGIDVEPLGRH